MIKIKVDVLCVCKGVLIRRAGTGPRYGFKNYTCNLIRVRIRCRSAILKVPRFAL